MYQKRLLILCCLCFFFIIPLKASTTTSPFPPHQQYFKQSRAIFADLSPRVIRYSIVYEQFFAESGSTASAFRIGGFATLSDLAIPIGISTISKRGDNHLEGNFTVVPYINNVNSAFVRDGRTDTQLFLLAGLGYRYQSTHSKWIARLMISPFLFIDPPSSLAVAVETRFSLNFTLGIGLKLD